MKTISTNKTRALALMFLLMWGGVSAHAQDCCNLAGDANNDGSMNIGDASFLISWIFNSTAPPPCPGEGDANASGSVNIGDVTYIIAYIFSGGPAPICPDPGLGPTDTANYIVTFTSVWSSLTHPDDFPANAHFSGLVGGTHNSNAVFWEAGGLSTQGIKQMAEFGSKSQLLFEVDTEILAGNAESTLSGGGIGPSPGSTQLLFSLTTEYPLVTLVSMVAPSPDWFVGVAGLPLHDGDQWVDSIEIELYPHDAGTDDGVTYTSANAVTTPFEPIAQMYWFPFLVGDTVPPMGTYRFVRQ